MFRRRITRVGLTALAGLGLSLIGGTAKADTQGWPLQGRGTQTASYPGRSYQAFSAATFGSSSPSYYATYQPSSPAAGGYYSSGSSEDYYRTSTTDTSAEAPARINLHVPADAKIWFDGSQTIQTGNARTFQSPPLAVGPEYTYLVRIQWNRDGKEVTQTRQVLVHASDVINLALDAAHGSPLAR